MTTKNSAITVQVIEIVVALRMTAKIIKTDLKHKNQGLTWPNQDKPLNFHYLNTKEYILAYKKRWKLLQEARLV